jgi:ribonuclease HI
MVVNRLPYLTLHSHARSGADRSEWSFTVASDDGSTQLGVSDIEPEISGERLELLSVIRGLEALDQPSNVTVVTSSRYVTQGLAYGLDEWRRNDWTWQCYGRREEINNADLWRRLDHLLDFHRVECRYLRVDRPRRVTSTAARSAHQPPSRVGRWLRSIVNGDGRDQIDGKRRERVESEPRRRLASCSGPHWKRAAVGASAG